MPIIDGAKVKSSIKSDNKDGLGHNIVISSDKTVEELEEFYDNKLGDANDYVRLKVAQGYSITGNKDGYDFMVLIGKNKESGNSVATITIVNKN